MLLARRVGAYVLVVAAIAIWFGMKPTQQSDTGYKAAIAAALAADQTNAAASQSAPQQQVVNGWTARDLLTVIAEEGAQSAGVVDERPAALLVIVVLGVALLLARTVVPALAAQGAHVERVISTMSAPTEPPTAATL